MSGDSSDKKPRHSLLRRLFERRGVRVFAICLWLLAGFMAAQILVLVAFSLLFPSGQAGIELNIVVASTILTALTYVLALLLVVGGAWWLKKWNKKQLMERIGLTRHLRFKDVVLAALGYLPYLACSILLVVVISVLVPGFNAEQPQELGFSALANNLEFILAFIALVILAPIAEEVLFRGYLFGSLRKVISFIPATFIVSALFGLVHGQWNVALDTFVLSVVLCWLRERTGTVWAPIVLHMIKNGLAFALLFVV